MEHHADSHAVHPDDMPFSDEEIKELHAEDLKAGTYVVGLMLAIFCIGVILYTIIAITAAA